jgi:drug/metabolite transporter (DMT)-like permease
MTASDFAPIALGLASAASWGAGDFSGGLATKRTGVYGVVIASQAVGGTMLMGLALLFGESVPPLADLLWGGLGGLAGAVGLLALYRALAAGRMGVAAPVSAVVAAAIPVVVGALVEGWPGALQLIGFGLALVAVWLISRSDEAALRVYDLGLPLVAGVGFGIFFIAIDHAGRSSVLWPVVAARTLSMTLLAATARLMRQPPLPDFAHWKLIALSGVLDAGGNAFYALAAHVGRLDVAAVLGSLYPASTVWLAWLILKERLTRAQWAGVGVALAAIVLIAA